MIVPGEPGQAVMPHSEVCTHLGIAGRVMSFVFLPRAEGLQLLHASGRAFSIPITPGEAGIHRDHRGRYSYQPSTPPAGQPHTTELSGDIDQRKRNALRLIESLTHCDHVLLTVNGRTHPMSIAGQPNRAEGGRGPWESTGVICSLGPSLWSVRVNVDDLAHGRHTLTKTSSAKTITMHEIYYHPDAVRDGDIPRDKPGTMIFDCYDWEPHAETVADYLRSEGLTQPSATDWAPRVWYGYPDGSFVDPVTGYCRERSAHLAGFTDAESRDIFHRITTNP